MIRVRPEALAVWGFLLPTLGLLGLLAVYPMGSGTRSRGGAGPGSARGFPAPRP